MRLWRLLRRDLAREVGAWIEDGLVDESQGRTILLRYGAKLEDARGTTRGYYVLSALAVLFAGLALIVIVSANWDEIPRMVRMAGLVGLTMVTNGIGIHRFYKDNARAGVLWLFFGGIAYGVSIMLIAQMYHLGEHYPDGILLWAVGVLPMVALTRSRLMAFLCLTLASIWMFVEIGEGFFPVWFPGFSVVCGWLVIRHRPSGVLFIACIAGVITWINVLLAWIAGGGTGFDPVVEQVPFTVAMGVLLSGVAGWLADRPSQHLGDYGLLLNLYLLRGAIVLLLTYSFPHMWRGLDSAEGISAVGAVLAIPLAGVFGLLMTWRRRPAGVPASVLLTAFFTLVFAIGCQPGMADIAAVLTNLMLVAAGIWLIRRGVDDAISYYFYTGIVVLLLTATFRYFDLIGDYVGGAMIFLVAAGILFGSARYWRTRVQSPEAGHV